jgi:hypothetical protein
VIVEVTLVILIVNAISGMTDADGKTAANRLKKDEAGKRLTSNQLPALRFADNSFITVDPVYSERGYSEYSIIVNGFLRTDR